MEFAGAIIAIYYLNRWIQKKRTTTNHAAKQLDLSFKQKEEPLLEAAAAPAVQVDLGSLAEEANQRDAEGTLVVEKSPYH